MSEQSTFLSAGVLLNTLAPLTEELGMSVPMTYVATLLHVAAAGTGGLDQGELTKKLGVSGPAAVRAVQALGDWSWLKDDDGRSRAGAGLVTSDPDPRGDKRLRVVRLTPKGERVVGKMAAKLKR